MKGLLFFLLTFIIIPCKAQFSVDTLSSLDKRNFNKITRESQYVPSAITTSIPILADYLTRNAKSELEIVRSFYVWISCNINYDMRSFKRNIYPNQDPDYVLASRTALCSGFSELFNDLCKQKGITSTIINGYSKGFGYTPGKEFIVSDHSWNAVRIKGIWFLVDVTWAGNKNNLTHTIPSEAFNENYFLTAPAIFVYDHLPLDPVWQLLETPVPLDVYASGNKAIDDYLREPKEYINFSDSLSTWSENPIQNKINSYRRSIAFNPKNKQAVFDLGYDLLLKATDIMDTAHDLPFENFDSLAMELKFSMFYYLDESAYHFANIKKGDANYKMASLLLEEVTYQKGVFYYEIGQCVYDLFLLMDEKTFYSNLSYGIHLINDYYDKSIHYFMLIDKNSRYYLEAMRYVNEFLRNKNPLIPRN